MFLLIIIAYNNKIHQYQIISFHFNFLESINCLDNKFPLFENNFSKISLILKTADQKYKYYRCATV